MNDEVQPEVGDIWKELDPRVEYQRFVKVTRVSGDHALIYGVEKSEDGEWQARKPRSPERWAQLKRFNGKRGGYELHFRPAGEAYLAEPAGVRV